MPSLYQYPEAYDAVMRTATDQLDLEVDVIHTLLKERGIANGRILELGSGTSPHGLPLAQKGHTIVGIDISPPMLAYARNAARALSVPARYVHADLLDFTLKAPLFDCAIFMAETFTLITDYDDIANHFGAVRRHLKPGAFYLIDIDAQRAGYRYANKTWGKQTVVIHDGHVDLYYEDHAADWVRGINRLTMHCRIHTSEGNVTTTDQWHIRLYNPWTLSLLIKTQPGWSLNGFYSYQTRLPDIERDDNYFMLLEAV